MREHPPSLQAFGVAAAIYSLSMALWIYLVLDPNIDEAPTWLLGPIALLHLGTGYLAGRWTAVLLAITPVFVALPAGYPGSNFGEPLALSGTLLIGAPFGLCLIAIGVGLRRRSAG